MKQHRRIPNRFGMVKHCEVIDRTARLNRIIGERDIRGGQLFPVRKPDVIPDFHRPEHPVRTRIHCNCQVIPNLKVFAGHRQGAVEQRFMHVFARAPAINRVEARFRFGVWPHRHHNCIPLRRLRNRWDAVLGCAAGYQEAGGKYACKNLF